MSQPTLTTDAVQIMVGKLCRDIMDLVEQTTDATVKLANENAALRKQLDDLTKKAALPVMDQSDPAKDGQPAPGRHSLPKPVGGEKPA